MKLTIFLLSICLRLPYWNVEIWVWKRFVNISYSNSSIHILKANLRAFLRVCKVLSVITRRCSFWLIDCLSWFMLTGWRVGLMSCLVSLSVRWVTTGVCWLMLMCMESDDFSQHSGIVDFLFIYLTYHSAWFMSLPDVWIVDIWPCEIW